MRWCLLFSFFKYHVSTTQVNKVKHLSSRNNKIMHGNKHPSRSDKTFILNHSCLNAAGKIFGLQHGLNTFTCGSTSSVNQIAPPF